MKTEFRTAHINHANATPSSAIDVNSQVVMLLLFECGVRTFSAHAAVWRNVLLGCSSLDFNHL